MRLNSYDAAFKDNNGRDIEGYALVDLLGSSERDEYYRGRLEKLSPEKQLAIGREIAQGVEDKMKLAQTEKENSTTGKQVADTFLAAL